MATSATPVLSPPRLKAALAALPIEILARVYSELGQGRHLEAQRVLAEHGGDSVAAKEIVASLIRRAWLEVRKDGNQTAV